LPRVTARRWCWCDRTPSWLGWELQATRQLSSTAPRVDAHRGNFEAAGRLLGFSHFYHATRQRPRSFGSRAVYDRLLAQLHIRLPADVLEQLLVEGASIGDAATTEECLRIAASA
jgi:hypothetical protein